ncbi:MAG: barnase inhibitor [Acidobacteriota bacterium]|nr:barnase inhibitor [Acidobacteriota bacterium]
MSKPIYIIDGNNFSTYEELFREITQVLAPGAIDSWIHSLDALNDYLYRGDDKPREAFILVWKDSALSKTRLGYSETIRRLESSLKRCHPSNIPILQERIALAKQNQGITFFDEIIDIIREHEDIELRLG